MRPYKPLDQPFGVQRLNTLHDSNWPQQFGRIQEGRILRVQRAWM